MPPFCVDGHKILIYCRYKKPLQGMAESMQQSSATPSYISFFGGCGRLLHALNHTLQWLLVATVFGTVSSYFDFYTCRHYIGQPYHYRSLRSVSFQALQLIKQLRGMLQCEMFHSELVQQIEQFHSTSQPRGML